MAGRTDNPGAPDPLGLAARRRGPRFRPFAATQAPALTRAGLLATGLLLAGLSGACQTQGLQGRNRDQQATYTVRALRTELAPEIRVSTCAAAGEAVLRARGFSIAERTITEDSARIVGKAPNDGLFERTIFESYVTPRGTGMLVRVEPWGDEAASRTILDEVLVRLGR